MSSALPFDLHAIYIALMVLALLLVLTGSEASAQPAEQSLYQINLPVDISVTAGATLTLISMYVWQDRLNKPRCPCDVSEVWPTPARCIHHSMCTMQIIWQIPSCSKRLPIGATAIHRWWV